MRSILYDYWDVMELPIGEIPYVAIDRALKDEKYMRKFNPTYAKNDFKEGHLSALLYWYPHYVDLLFEIALENIDWRVYFEGTIMLEHFEHLFPQTVRRLDRIKERPLKTNHLLEIKF